MKLPRHYREKTLAPRPSLWYFTVTLTSIVEDSPLMTLKPPAPIAQKLQSATPPTNVLVGRRSNPRPASSGIPDFPLLPPLRPRGAAPFTQTSARAQSPDGRIAFESDGDGNAEIYAMNADGSGVERLTSNSALDDGPSWSPDGRRIAFFSERDESRSIYAMNAAGSGVTRLTHNSFPDSSPSWGRGAIPPTPTPTVTPAPTHTHTPAPPANAPPPAAAARKGRRHRMRTSRLRRLGGRGGGEHAVSAGSARLDGGAQDTAAALAER